ncbi:hypothetical protein [Pseudotamlana carrageenivorans]|uniref:Uncharacterized protein n=1 Tax=Pseudotamlana carrageenivorans TaxID=2069432 RepID=A0A2I7SLS9_9FLAO|nr:hypothetical protein [Tamlana carrageenivorans]AUS06863.1 hypothetical protein C1A40_16055 [Tamlana carrageenivorans]
MMRKIVERITQELLMRRVFKKYKNSLPTKSVSEKPKMDYHVLADAVVWNDEGIKKCNPELENALRYALNYRTSLIVDKNFEIKKKNSNSIGKRTFELAKKYFPNWIGFEKKRCEYNQELSDRIKRIRKVSEWKIERLMNSEET